MTDQLRQAAQAVIKAWDNDGSTQTMEDLRAALEQQAEPVQEQKYEKRIAPYSTTLSMLLNTAPPQQQAEQVDCPRCGHVCSPKREWVGLTDEEIKATWSQLWYDLNHGKLSAPDAAVRSNVVVFGEALEAKLKERNHD